MNDLEEWDTIVLQMNKPRKRYELLLFQDMNEWQTFRGSKQINLALKERSETSVLDGESPAGEAKYK